MDNFIECKSRIGRNTTFVFVDDKHCSARSLFFKHKVVVLKQEIMQNPDMKYQLSFCTVRTKDRRKIIDAIREIPTKMQIIGNTDYEQEAHRLLEYLKSDAKTLCYD